MRHKRLSQKIVKKIVLEQLLCNPTFTAVKHLTPRCVVFAFSKANGLRMYRVAENLNKEKNCYFS